MIRTWAVVVLLVAFAFNLVPGARAQSSGGTIAGTVLDTSGALIPNVTVVAVGADTGTTYTTVSSSSGAFRFPQMQLGRYNLTFTAAGFSTQKLNGILVTTGNVSPAEAHLETGGVNSVVTVDETAPVVETENTEVSNTISARQIVDLPLSLEGQSAFRSVETFIFLAPGTVGPGTAGSTSGAFQSRTAGGQNFGTEELLDGLSVRREDSNSAFDEHAPSIEALTELKVTTSIIPASEGRTTGGVENFTTRSGTNQYHGTAFDIFQNEDLNANDYFHKLRIAQNPGNQAVFANNQRDIDKKNDYGGSIGGPLSIPHLYNAHDRTFGFFSFEQFRQSQSGVAVSAIPTVAVRGGDFSSQLTNTLIPGEFDCNGGQVFRGEILDPATTRIRPNGTPCRLPFPGNRIDPARFSTVAQNILSFLPLPNTGTPNQTTQNYSYATTFPRLNTSYTIRVDHNLTEKAKIFGTYTNRDNFVTNGHPPYPGAGGGVQVQGAKVQYLRFGVDYAFSPVSFNHFVVGFNRLYQNNRALSVDQGGGNADYDQILGIAGASGPAFPAISYSSTAVPSYNGIGYNNDSIQPVNLFAIGDTYTFIKGRHTVNLGADFRKDQFSNEDKGGNSGSFSFSQFQTAAAPGDTLSGDGFASLLLGRVYQGSLTVQSRAPASARPTTVPSSRTTSRSPTTFCSTSVSATTSTSPATRRTATSPTSAPPFPTPPPAASPAPSTSPAMAPAAPAAPASSPRPTRKTSPPASASPSRQTPPTAPPPSAAASASTTARSTTPTSAPRTRSASPPTRTTRTATTSPRRTATALPPPAPAPTAMPSTASTRPSPPTPPRPTSTPPSPTTKTSAGSFPASTSPPASAVLPPSITGASRLSSSLPRT